MSYYDVYYDVHNDFFILIFYCDLFLICKILNSIRESQLLCSALWLRSLPPDKTRSDKCPPGATFSRRHRVVKDGRPVLLRFGQ